MKKSIAHIFNSSTNHLNQTIALCIDSRKNDSFIFLRDVEGFVSAEQAIRINQGWIKRLNYTRFAGVLQRPKLSRMIGYSGRVGIALSFLLSDFSFSSWWKIFRGPKYIVIHGYLLSFFTLTLLRCMRKRIVYINWAGPPNVSGRYLGWINKFALKLLYKIFVLMQPEIVYFTKYVGEQRVGLLPYPVLYEGETFSSYDEEIFEKVLLIGNSCWCLDGYEFVLDRIAPNEWTKIICMMNYGRESEVDYKNRFIAKYKQKFGDAFFPWCETVSIEEYKKIISVAPFYICPAVRQSGLGLIRQAILQGKAIFLAGDNFSWIKDDMGLDVHDIKICNDFNFSTLRQFLPSYKECQERFEKALAFWMKYHSLEKWNNDIANTFE